MNITEDTANRIKTELFSRLFIKVIPINDNIGREKAIVKNNLSYFVKCTSNKLNGISNCILNNKINRVMTRLNPIRNDVGASGF
jgi:hypothetical protein